MSLIMILMLMIMMIMIDGGGGGGDDDGLKVLKPVLLAYVNIFYQVLVVKKNIIVKRMVHSYALMLMIMM